MKKAIIPLLFILTIPIVLAHEAHGGGLINGILHPIFGPDHLLAMISVG